MRITVCIKQVPSGSIPMDSRGILDRRGDAGQLNPGDRYALEGAMLLKEAFGGQVTALTMGPESSEAVLKAAFSLGADRGIRMTDRAFAGADVYATGYTLAQGILALGGADLVICGQQTTDGDTAQLPSSLAWQLGMPVYGWVKALEAGEGRLKVLQELSGGTQQAEVSGPAVLAVGEGIGRPRVPSLRDQLRAKQKQAEVLRLSDLSDRDPEHYGLRGSPTRVIGVKTLERIRKHSPIPLSGEEGAEAILAAIREEWAHE